MRVSVGAVALCLLCIAAVAVASDVSDAPPAGSGSSMVQSLGELLGLLEPSAPRDDAKVSTLEEVFETEFGQPTAVERLRKGDFVFVCKESVSRLGLQSNCNGCRQAILDRNIAKFKLGLVTRIDREQKVKYVAVVAGWGPVGEDGYAAGPADEVWDPYLIRPTEAVPVQELRFAKYDACVRPVGYRGVVSVLYGTRGIDEALRLASAELNEFMPETADLLRRNLGLETRTAGSVRTKWFMVQLEEERQRLAREKAGLLEQWRLRRKAQRLRALADKTTGLHTLRSYHSELSGVVADLLCVIKGRRCERGLMLRAGRAVSDVAWEDEPALSCAGGRRPGSGSAGSPSADGDDSDPEVNQYASHSEAMKRLGQIVTERRGAKWEEYVGILEGFGFFSTFLVAAALDAGVPGLGSLIEFGVIGGREGERALRSVIDSIEGSDAMKAALAKVQASMRVIDRNLNRAAGLTGAVVGTALTTAKDEVVGTALDKASEAASEEADAVLHEGVGRLRNDLADTRRNWKAAIDSIVETAKTDCVEAVKVGGEEGAWTAAAMIPLIGPYVGMTREINAIVSQLRESRAAFRDYQEAKDTIYDSVMKMRDCGLVTSLAYEPPKAGDLSFRLTSKTRRNTRRASRVIEGKSALVKADMMSLRATVEAAVAAMRANYRLKERISNTHRLQELFTFREPTLAHETRVVSRVNRRFGTAHLTPREWSARYSGAIIEACAKLNDIYRASGVGAAHAVCCEENEESCLAEGDEAEP